MRSPRRTPKRRNPLATRFEDSDNWANVRVAAPSPTMMTPLAAGRYYITVEDLGGDDFDATTPYTLTITVAGP